MTAQPSSQAEREDVAREVLAEQLHGFGELRRAILSGDNVTGDPMIGPVPVIAAMLAFSDREHATPRSMPEEEEIAADMAHRIVCDFRSGGWPAKEAEVARLILGRFGLRSMPEEVVEAALALCHGATDDCTDGRRVFVDPNDFDALNAALDAAEATR